ncbi:hypothetical protein [Paenarthrobacter ilicis]|uniref:hypothetical protein n=1 Tax=Paenarthrobacter ilicis TaxID=43665 RepID=UPI003867050E
MQDYFDFVQREPETAHGPAIQEFASLNFHWSMPDTFDHIDQALQAQVGRKGQESRAIAVRSAGDCLEEYGSFSVGIPSDACTWLVGGNDASVSPQQTLK